MPLSTWQRQDEGIVLVEFDYYKNNGVHGAEFVGTPQRVRRPVASLIGVLRTGTYVGNSYDVEMDVWIQTRLGDLWFDVIQFNRVATDGGTTNNGYAQKISATEPSSRLSQKASDLVGGNSAHFIGEEWRARWKLFGEASTTAYQFGVTIVPVG
jgi:hypothetical protein